MNLKGGEFIFQILSTDPDTPLVGVFTVAELNGLQLFEESSRQFTGSTIVDFDLFIPVTQFANRRNDRRLNKY